MEKVKCIHLPPIPAEFDGTAVAAIWEFAKLPEEEKKVVAGDLEKMLGYKKCEEPDMEFVESHAEIIENYMESMRKMIVCLYHEISSLACWVFEGRYVEGKSLEEMIEEQPHAAEQIVAMINILETSNTKH